MKHVSENIMETIDLSKHFPLKDKNSVVQALDNVSLSVPRGKTLSVVGESGCGKSTFARAAIRLIEPTSGTSYFEGKDLMSLRARELRNIRRDIQLIFQDPFASLNPRRNVGKAIMEPLTIHNIGSREERLDRVSELLNIVGLPAEAAQRYPHEFSGGQRQRIVIARAMALQPKLVVADEPVSALDVSIQSQILNLLVELKDRLSLSYIFISHDLAVVKHISDRVAVMYLGKVVEEAEVDDLFNSPLHPYTMALLSAIPRTDFAGKEKSRILLKGDVPDPSDPPSGCRFHPRCPLAIKICGERKPLLTIKEGKGKRHLVSCHLQR
jgi:oligopeptide transport system ATP-binding protein